MRFHPRRKVVQFIAPKETLIVSDQRGFHRGWQQMKGAYRVLVVDNFYERT